jgi:hypothetical protein
MKTPVGYRCPDCIRSQQDVFFTINQASYAIAGIVAFVLAIPAVYIAVKLNFLFLIIVLGIPVGGFISEAVHRAIKRQRGRYTWLVVAVAVVLGGLAVTLFEVKDFLPLLSTPQFGDEAFTISDLLTLMAPGLIMTGLTAFTAAARFRYGK